MHILKAVNLVVTTLLVMFHRDPTVTLLKALRAFFFVLSARGVHFGILTCSLWKFRKSKMPKCVCF